MSSQEILVRPNQLRTSADRLQASAAHIQAAIRRVDDLIRLPSHVLDGYQAQRIRSRYQKRRECLADYHQRILYFAEQLDRIADRMEAADRKLSGEKSRDAEFRLDWLDIFSHFFNALGIGGKELLDIIEKFVSGRLKFKGQLKNLGMEKIYKYFSKSIPYRGQLDKFIKKFGEGFILVGIVLDTIKDVNKGVPLIEAFTVNTITALEVKGLSAVHPAVAVAFLINSGIQMVGQVSIGMQEMFVDAISPDRRTHDLLMENIKDYEQGLDKFNLENVIKEPAQTLYNVLVKDYVDVGTKTFNGLLAWATKDRSLNGFARTVNAITEYTYQVLPPTEMLERTLLPPTWILTRDPRTYEGIGKTTQAVGSLFDGYFDMLVASTSQNVMTATVVGANALNQVDGLPQSSKDSINDAAYNFIKPVREIADWIIN